MTTDPSPLRQAQKTVADEIKASSLKPMCNTCLRRIYGREKHGGWWCHNCEQWIVQPRHTR